jgi:hypothetical protein
VSGSEFDDALAEIDRVVRERRAEGAYPNGLERQLEAEFRSAVRAAHRATDRSDALRAAVASVDVAVHQVDIGTSTTSRVPLGSLMHGATARLMSRQTGPLAETTRALGESIVSALVAVEAALTAQQSADERQLLDVLAGVLDRLAVIDHLVEVLGDLDARVAAIEQRPEAAP